MLMVSSGTAVNALGTFYL